MGIVKMVTQSQSRILSKFIYPLYTHMIAAGPLLTIYTRTHHSAQGIAAGPLAIYYTMRALCYDCWADSDTQESIWLCSLWVTALPAGGVRFWIAENRVSLALLADPLLRPRPTLDYYL